MINGHDIIVNELHIMREVHHIIEVAQLITSLYNKITL